MKTIGWMLLALLSTAPLHASTWLCSAFDSNKIRWQAQHEHRMEAARQATLACRRDSSHPATCTQAYQDCQKTDIDINAPAWVCIAVDASAQSWHSNPYPNQADAAIAAQDYCKSKSTVPDTCFVNTISCQDYRKE